VLEQAGCVLIVSIRGFLFGGRTEQCDKKGKQIIGFGENADRLRAVACFLSLGESVKREFPAAAGATVPLLPLH
jgi:hypothetical protein